MNTNGKVGGDEKTKHGSSAIYSGITSEKTGMRDKGTV